MTSGLRPVGHAVALIKWARGRKCECPLRVNRESAYARTHYRAILLIARTDNLRSI
jgi:hypothetical protein